MAAVLTLDPRGGHPDFLDLPWSEPLAAWDHPRVVRMARGESRHVVRFVEYGDRVYALKETSPALARGEYRLLREMATDGLPVVEAVGVVTGRRKASGPELPAMLVTRYLDYSLPYQYLFGAAATDRSCGASSSTPACCCSCACTSKGCSGVTARSRTPCSAGTPAR